MKTVRDLLADRLIGNFYVEESKDSWHRTMRGGRREKTFTLKGKTITVLEVEHPLKEGWSRFTIPLTKKNVANLDIS